MLRVRLLERARKDTTRCDNSRPCNMCFLIVLIFAVVLTPSILAAEVTVSVEGYKKTEVYHSPQIPGYTCWTGATVKDDGEILLSFVQATGPIEGRPHATDDVLAKLSWPPEGNFKYDMTGLDLRNVYLASSDGTLWNPLSYDAFQSPMNGTAASQTMAALTGNTIVRAVWGQYLPNDNALADTSVLQRSTDGGRTWKTVGPIMDPTQYTTWIKRLRVLKDGRLIALGGLSHAAAGSLNRSEYFAPGVTEPMLLVSEDQGLTWSNQIQVIPPENRDTWSGEEYDVAEMPNGDLLCVFRRVNPNGPGEIRWQARLRKQDQTWVTTDQFGPAPFPHSGNPELLAIREGIVLHIATSGIHWTADGGDNWIKLDLPGTQYYPRSVQASDGTVYIFAHRGWDNAYGECDQAIIMDSFKLKVQGVPSPSSAGLLLNGGLMTLPPLLP